MIIIVKSKWSFNDSWSLRITWETCLKLTTKPLEWYWYLLLGVFVSNFEVVFMEGSTTHPWKCLVLTEFFFFLFEGARIAKRGLYQWINEKLKIPQCEPTIKSSFVKVSYVLEFKVFVGFGKNLKIRLPLVIGTVPHRLSMEHQQHQDQRQNHQSRQANMTHECKSHI